MAVAVAEALVLGRAVAPEHAREICRQAPGKGRERRGKRLGLGRGEGQTTLGGGERGVGLVAACRPCPAGRQEDRQGAQRPQHRAAGERTRHRVDSCAGVSG